MRPESSYYRSRLWLVCIALWLLTFAHVSSATNAPLDATSISNTPAPLAKYFDVLEDATHELTIDDVRQDKYAAQFVDAKRDSSSVSLGYSHSAFWLRLRVTNPSDKEVSRVLEFSNPSLAIVQIHLPQGDGGYSMQRTGSQLPFHTRPYAHRNFVFPLTLPAHSDQVLFVRVQSERPMAILGELWEPDSFRSHERIDYVGQAWYFGIASAMVVFNLLLFIALRDLIYLRYVLFMLSMATAIAAQNGLIKEFLIQDAPWWSTKDVMISFCVTVIFALGFMRHMMQTREVAPTMDTLARVCTWIMGISIAGLMLNQRLVIQPVTSLIGIVVIFIFVTALVCAWRRQRSAYFFVAAFSLLCGAGVLMVLRSLSVIPPSFLTENALRIGSACEMLLLAFALGDRFNVIRQEKVNAQRASIEAQKRLVETLQTSERELERRVALRTAELDQTNHDLKQAIASREDVERIARHDIKTPLGSLAAGPGLLRAFIQPGPQGEVILRMMEKAANRALDMVNLSLDLYQMENGSYVFHPLRVNLSEILQSVVEDLAVHAQSKSVYLVISGHEPAVYVQGNDSLCYSIIANLTKNAVEAAPELSTVTLTVKSGAYVHLNIHNQGEVPAQLKEHFFSKYSTSGKTGGTGLGTYSAQLLARVQGGTLTMVSNKEGGTTLTLTLAGATEHPSTAAAETTSSPSVPTNDNRTTELAALNVLVVDDDEFNLMVMESYLPQPPLVVSTAVNGRLALQRAIDSRPDLIILDVEMPVMDGMEALARIRQHQASHGQTPSFVAAYSGSGDPQSTSKYLAAGFDTCLKKPTSASGVLALLNQCAMAAQAPKDGH